MDRSYRAEIERDTSALKAAQAREIEDDRKAKALSKVLEAAILSASKGLRRSSTATPCPREVRMSPLAKIKAAIEARVREIVSEEIKAHEAEPARKNGGVIMVQTWNGDGRVVAAGPPTFTHATVRRLAELRRG